MAPRHSLLGLCFRFINPQCSHMRSFILTIILTASCFGADTNAIARARSIWIRGGVICSNVTAVQVRAEQGRAAQRQMNAVAKDAGMTPTKVRQVTPTELARMEQEKKQLAVMRLQLQQIETQHPGTLDAIGAIAPNGRGFVWPPELEAWRESERKRLKQKR